MIRVGIIRHGRTSWNRQGLLQGQTDIPLEDGEPERIGGLALPPPWDAVDVVASPLSRADQTARILSGGVPKTDPRITEMNFGSWEGQAGRDLKADPASGFRDVENWGWEYRPPGGESPREVWARVEAALANLERDTLFVCHMIVMRVILATAHGWDFEGEPPFQVKRDRIYGLNVGEGVLTADPKPTRLVPRCE